MKRIIFVSHSHKLEGGAEFSLLATVQAAKKRGYLCLVILPSEGSFADRLQGLGVEYEIQNYTWSAMSSYDTEAHLNLGIAHFNADSIVAAHHTLQRFKPHLVAINTIMPPWYAYAAKSLDIPVVMMIRESYDKRNSTRLLPVAEEYLDNISHSMDHVFYNSLYTKNMYSKYINKPTSSVYYPVVEIEERYKPLLKKSIKPILNETVSIITPGSIVEHKNQLDLLKAVSLLKDRGYKNISITLMGHMDKKGYVDILKKYIKNNSLDKYVTVLGFSDSPFEEISKHQFVVVPSKSEAFGRVTLEGQLLGRLVIGCNAGGTKELITDKSTGLLYDPASIESLADTIEWAIKNPIESATVAKQGQISAKERFLTKKAYDPFFETVKKVIASHTINEKRVPYYDPVYALIQRNLHVDDILSSYARSLESAAEEISRLTQQTAVDDIKKHARKILHRVRNKLP